VDFSPWFVIGMSTLAGAVAALVLVLIKAHNPRIRLVLVVLLLALIGFIAWSLYPAETRVTRISSGATDSD
jgi:hypothetical protein